MLTTIEQSLILATYFRGNHPDQNVWTSSCDKVVTLSLYYTGDISSEECVRRFAKRQLQTSLYVDNTGELRTEVRERYHALIQLMESQPDLIHGGGKLRPPADPTYTACRLTAAGDALIPELITRFPQKPDFPNSPDKRTWPSDAGASLGEPTPS